MLAQPYWKKPGCHRKVLVVRTRQMGAKFARLVESWRSIGNGVARGKPAPAESGDWRRLVGELTHDSFCRPCGLYLSAEVARIVYAGLSHVAGLRPDDRAAISDRG